MTDNSLKPFNIASLLTEAAARHPEMTAAVVNHRPDTKGRFSLTYAQLESDSSNLAAALLHYGFVKDDRVIVMIQPGLDFFIVIFAMFKAGLIPVMVDPGMGLKRMLLCLSEGRPRGMIGQRSAHFLSLLAPHYFRDIKLRVTLGQRWGWSGTSLDKLLSHPHENYPMAETNANDTAAILFTSGATGLAKGTIYTHSMFQAQIESLRHNFNFQEGGVDLATFPLFALFSPALGLTSIIPNMNPTKPGQADPRRITDTIIQEKVTSFFASPALLAKLAEYAQNQGLKLNSLTRVISAGAPVQPKLAAAISAILPDEAELLTPYGATEAMPLTIITAREIAEIKAMTEQGFGMCVGKALPEHQIAIIPISDDPRPSFKSEQILPVGEVGEIVATGPVVSQSYFERPKETALTIMSGPDQKTWRRMGDLGWQDAQGRLWFCGRKSQRVVTEQGSLFTISCEAIFNNHHLVKRTALVGVGTPGRQKPVIVVETKTRMKKNKWKILVEELTSLAKTNPRTRNITLFLRHQSFPVDIRHNAKINREKLANWASTQVAAFLID